MTLRGIKLLCDEPADFTVCDIFSHSGTFFTPGSFIHTSPGRYQKSQKINNFHSKVSFKYSPFQLIWLIFFSF